MCDGDERAVSPALLPMRCVLCTDENMRACWQWEQQGRTGQTGQPLPLVVEGSITGHLLPLVVVGSITG